MLGHSFPKLWLGLALILYLAAASAEEECSVRVGEYSGRVKAEWLTKSRQMRLLEDFAFKGPDCRVWAVPKGAIIDGASIPRVFWTVLGGPFDGPYRDASVVHDYYCKVRTAPSEQVHDMFYHALLANGVDSNTASLMFYGVSWFGPRWQILKRVAITSEDYDAFTIVRNVKDLRFPTDVLKQISGTAGQPSPLEPGLSSAMEFEPRLGGQTYGVKWLQKDGNVLDKAGEMAAPDAFAKAVQPTFSKPYSDSSGTAVRFYSAGPAAAEPTEADLLRLRTWIDKERPSLSTLKSTPPDRIR